MAAAYSAIASPAPAAGQRQRRQRGLAGTLFACALLCASRAFVGGSGRMAAVGRDMARAPMRVNIFEGLQAAFSGLPADKQANRDANTEVSFGARAQREASDASRVVECDMPLGIEFEEKEEGNIYIKRVDPSSSAYERGVRPGALLCMVSATFGDDMWNARGVGMRQVNTVITTRYGASIKLALEKEDTNFLDGFFRSFKGPEMSDADKKKKETSLLAEFEKTENELGGKNMWNPFR